MMQASTICTEISNEGGLQVGGGINLDNCLSYIEEGASHVIVTSYVFNNGQMDLQRLKGLVHVVGRQRLVLDLSCRKKVGNNSVFSTLNAKRISFEYGYCLAHSTSFSSLTPDS
ncbi:hypothetical protein REPUB_Repub02eG0220800 [Reevesia pubescens]